MKHSEIYRRAYKTVGEHPATKSDPFTCLHILHAGTNSGNWSSDGVAAQQKYERLFKTDGLHGRWLHVQLGYEDDISRPLRPVSAKLLQSMRLLMLAFAIAIAEGEEANEQG